MDDYPHITVATVVEKEGKYLMVKERSDGAIVYNQPAGHLELGETLLQAAVRETAEETAWQVKLSAFLGVYHFVSPNNGITYIRHCFVAQAIKELEDRSLDPDIEEALWLELDEIKQLKSQLRSPLVLTTIEDYLVKPLYPLSVLNY